MYRVRIVSYRLLYKLRLMKVYFTLAIFMLLALTRAGAQVENIRQLQQTLPKLTDSLQYTDALNRIALLQYEQNIDSTLYYTNIARSIAKRHQYAKGIADATNNLGIVFDVKGNTPIALRYYNDAFNQYTALGDTANMAQTLMNIGVLYDVITNDPKAISNFTRALALSSRLTNDSIHALVIYNFIDAFPNYFTPDSAAVYINKAVSIATKYNDTRILVALDQLKANLLIKSGKRNEAIALLKQTVEKTTQMQLYYLSLDPLTELGDVLASTDTAAAAAYYKKALQITRQYNFNGNAKPVLNQLYKFYVKLNNTQQAFYYSKLLLDEYRREALNNYESGVDYIEYAIKEQQLEAVSIKSTYSVKLLWLAGVICLLALTIIVILLRNRRRHQHTLSVLQNNFNQLEATTHQLEESNKNYARLIRIVAHDLRNPIGSINSISALVLDGDSITGEDKQWISLIKDSSKNCLQLIGELLETDFIINQANLNKQNISLSALLTQAAQLLGFNAREKGQHLVLHDAAHATLHADYNKLARVINNLVVNAIKFSPEGSEILIETSRTPEGILIAVKDNGIGIPPNIGSKLFEPFTQAQRAGTAGEKSFGLGLYISKQIIEAHGGRIWFTSQPGQGTTFYILLSRQGHS